MFGEILEERFALSGQTVKSLLVSEIKLGSHLEFLQYSFLFKDDLIYHFYQKLFMQVIKIRCLTNLMLEFAKKCRFRFFLKKTVKDTEIS